MQIVIFMGEIISLAKKIISEYYLCDHCLGRMFGGLSTGLSNEERGRIIKEFVKMDIHKKLLERKYIPRKILYSFIYRYHDEDTERIIKKLGITIKGKSRKERCEICGGLFENLDKIIEELISEILEYDFNSYVVGVESYPEIEYKEESLKKRFGIWFGESVRSELSREIGKYLDKYFKSINKQTIYDPNNPEANIIFNLRDKKVMVETKPFLIIIRISRISREIPIFAKTCRYCNGRGCEICDFLGKERGETLEYLLGRILIKITGGIKWKFSIKYLNKDKNDIQIYFKIVNPKKRRFDIEEITNKLNFIERKGFKIYSVEIY